jgi:carbon storage regulator
MLVLTRRTNESIIINGDIEVMIVEVRGGQVKLGIKAPANVVVVRKEIQKQHSDRDVRAEHDSAHRKALYG